MDLVLFDRKTYGTAKKVIKPLFTRVSLFDGYLTEPTSYPHFAEKGNSREIKYQKS
jgi:hypothetical protein